MCSQSRRGAVAQASYILDAGDREVSVAVLEPPVVDDCFEDIEIPVPGCAGVSIAADGDPVCLDDVLDLYADALRDEEDVTGAQAATFTEGKYNEAALAWTGTLSMGVAREYRDKADPKKVNLSARYAGQGVTSGIVHLAACRT